MKVLLGLMLTAMLVGCATGAKETAKEEAPKETRKFEHVQLSVMFGAFVFFDEKTGDVWMYEQPGKPGTLLARMEKLGDAMKEVESEGAKRAAVTPRVVEFEAVTTPLKENLTPAAVERLNPENAVVAYLNSLPKELWWTNNETEAVALARMKWLEMNKPPAAANFVGIIKDVSMRNLDAVDPPVPGRVKEALFFNLDAGKVTIWGEEKDLELRVTFDSVSADEGLKWKKGQRVRVAGKVTHAFASQFSIAVVHLSDAKLAK